MDDLNESRAKKWQWIVQSFAASADLSDEESEPASCSIVSEAEAGGPSNVTTYCTPLHSQAFSSSAPASIPPALSQTLPSLGSASFPLSQPSTPRFILSNSSALPSLPPSKEVMSMEENIRNQSNIQLQTVAEYCASQVAPAYLQASKEELLLTTILTHAIDYYQRKEGPGSLRALALQMAQHQSPLPFALDEHDDREETNSAWEFAKKLLQQVWKQLQDEYG